MDRIRLAYVAHGLSTNGIESLLVSIVQHIDRKKYDVTFILALDPDVIPVHEPTVQALGIRIIHVCDLDTLEKKRRYVAALRGIFEAERFDIVHAHMDLLNGLVLRAAKKAGVPRRISHAHTSKSPFSLGDFSLRKAAQALYHTSMQRLILRNATDFLGCSDIANTYFYGKREAVLIHNGADLSRLADARQNGDAAPDLQPAAVHLVTVGRVSLPKNPLFLVQIMVELAKLRQDFVLHWAGTGELFDAVRDEVEKNGLQAYVQLLGRRTDIPQILAGCELFLLPSLFEGLPVVLIEAQASGLPCLVSDTVTHQIDAGGCRFLSLDLGAEGWAKAIDDMLRSDDRPIVDPQRLRLFDIRNTIEELDRVYTKV